MTPARKALIIGVSGQDGAYLARHLCEAGYGVLGTCRAADAVPANLVRLGLAGRVRLLPLDPCDGAAVEALLEGERPDEIYMLSAQSSVGLSFECPAETFEANAVAVVRLLEALRRLNLAARTFFAGSSECFGDTDIAADCDTPLRPASPYATAKAFAFWQVATYRAAYGLHVATGVLFSHESPLRGPAFVTRRIVEAAVRIASGSGETLEVGPLYPVRDWGWAPEYVEAMHRMLLRDTPRDFIIATGRSVALERFTELVFREAGLDWRDHVRVRPERERPNNIRRSLAEVSRTACDLGWQARFQVEDVARELVRHQRAGGTV